jgi:hypothetical protein
MRRAGKEILPQDLEIWVPREADGSSKLKAPGSVRLTPTRRSLAVGIPTVV